MAYACQEDLRRAASTLAAAPLLLLREAKPPKA